MQPFKQRSSKDGKRKPGSGNILKVLLKGQLIGHLFCYDIGGQIYKCRFQGKFKSELEMSGTEVILKTLGRNEIPKGKQEKKTMQ